MSLWGSITHAVSTGWNDLFGDDEQKKKQQQQQLAKAQQKVNFGQPAVQNQSQNSSQPDQPAAPALNLYQGPQKAPLKPGQPAPQVQQPGPPKIADAAALVKAKPTPPPVAPQPGNPSIISRVGSVVKKAAGLNAAEVLGVNRAAQGVAQGALETPALLYHAADWVANKVTGNTGNSRLTKAVDTVTKKVVAPVKTVSEQTDALANKLTPTAHKVYTGTQIGANVATLVPGSEAVLSKIPGASKTASKIADITNLRKASVGSDAVAGSDISSEIGATAPSPDLADGVKSTNPTQHADHAIQTEAANPPPPVVPPPEPVNNTPAFQRGYGPKPATPEVPPSTQDLYKAEQSAARGEHSVNKQTYEGGLDPNNPVDAVPAYQRRGVEQSPETQAKIIETQKQLDAMPAPDASRSIIYNLKQKYGEMLRENPEQAPAIRQHLAASIKAANKVASDREKLQSQLDDLTLGTADYPTGGEVPAPPPEPTKNVTDLTQPETIPQAPAPQPVINPAVAREAQIASSAKEVGLTPEEYTAQVHPSEGEIGSAPAPTTPQVAPPEHQPLPEPPVSTGETAPMAPLSHDAATKQIADKELQGAFKGVYKMRDVVDMDALETNATARIDRLPPQEVAQRFSGVEKFNSPQEFIDGVHALRVLGEAPQTETTLNAVDGILNAVAEFQSKAGTNLRVGQVLWDNMPTQLKKATLVNRMRRNGIDIGADQENKIEELLQKSDDIAKTKTEAEAELAKLEEGMRDGTVAASSDRATAAIHELVTKYDAALREHEYADGAALDYYKSLLPKGVLGDRLAQDARVFMLSAPTGRIHDFLSTGLTTGVDLVNDTVQAGLGKVVNLVKGDKKALGTFPSLKKYVSGVGTGVKDTGRAMTRGEHRVSDFQGTLSKAVNRSNIEPTGSANWSNPLKKVFNATKNAIVGATESPTFLTQGRATAKLHQLAIQDGKELGLKGRQLKNFAEINSRLRSKADQMVAQQEHLQVNNLHRNGVSKWTTGMVQAAQNAAKGHRGAENVVPQIINQIAPFTSWVSGNIQRTLTDANVVSNATRLLQAVRRGDTDGATKAAARITTNGGLFAAGMLLSGDGHIVNHDANGKNYAGAYFKFGNRYFPVAIMGPFALPLIMGNSTHNASQKPGGLGDPKNLLSATGDIVGNTIKSVGATSTLGGSNAVQAGIANIGTGKQSSSDAAISIGAASAGQYIPGATRDVNSVLDNHTNLNPKHEAPLTKAYKTNDKGNKVVDRAQTAKNQLQTGVPVLSQKLSRQKGVPARDLVDRSLQGNRETAPMKAARVQKEADTKMTVAQSSTDKQANIPNPDDKNFDKAVQAHVENGQYDEAIKGLNQKITKSEKDPNNIPKSDVDKLKTKVKVLEVTKGYDPKIISTYSKTSLSEWRNMGDSTSDNYDPTTYALLYAYDSALAKAGVSSNTTKPTDTKYSAKKPGKGSGSGNKAANAALKKVTSNTLGSTPDLKNISFGNLSPQKISSAKIPTIQMIKSGELIKKRTISVGKAV